MGNVDKRNRLDEEVFTYSVTKDHKVFIHWLGKQVKILLVKRRIINKLVREKER